jgi:hypothetical protein
MYPGMTDKSTWRRSNVHRATSYYGCLWCGTRFADPVAVYTHLDKRHPDKHPAGASRAQRGSLRRASRVVKD